MSARASACTTWSRPGSTTRTSAARRPAPPTRSDAATSTQGLRTSRRPGRKDEVSFRTARRPRRRASSPGCRCRTCRWPYSPDLTPPSEVSPMRCYVAVRAGSPSAEHRNRLQHDRRSVRSKLRAWMVTRDWLALVVRALVVVVMSLAVAPVARAQASVDPLDAALSHDFSFAAGRLQASASSIPSGSYPMTSSAAGWTTASAGDWRSGFFAGALWLMYERTGDPVWKTRAEARTSGLRSQQTDTSTHDVGFKIFTSFGNAYRLSSPPNDDYRQVLLTAAGSLASRYSSIVGCTRSWNNTSTDAATDFKVIMDNMINLELLFWAAEHGGNPAWRDMAISHALKTRENHLRADGSVYQLVVYDSKTGAVKHRGNRQGANDESTWSRGEAWAIHAFTMAYRYTHDARFLDTARRAADFFLAHLPADKVPYWDLELTSTTGQPRDSSAAAIAASGLLELSQLETDAARAATDFDTAKAILTSLSS